ncbi:MAG: hspD [Alphaproteobacteria bacterium]|nr:hspD [Alphaproteobacteria bacterium]
MTRFDLTPLFRSTVGFDHLSRLVDSAFEAAASNDAGYPPYNIEKLSDEQYRITMAVAGFEQDDITLTQHDEMLHVKGAAKSEQGQEKSTFLHRGIAARAFERRFHLADHITVTGANMVNGLLHIDLLREVPEHKKPRSIEIGSKKPSLMESVKKLASA